MALLSSILWAWHGEQKWLMCTVPALQGAGAESTMVLNAHFRGSQAAESHQKWSINNVDIIEKLAYERSGFVISWGC